MTYGLIENSIDFFSRGDPEMLLADFCYSSHYDCCSVTSFVFYDVGIINLWIKLTGQRHLSIMYSSLTRAPDPEDGIDKSALFSRISFVLIAML